ncbi:DUF5005 domain-containing protein [Microlunatus sp. Gsoil 973]|uniref:DUF5005 domain-containing protein n=1 Tax=Microlunatus sp. Gsoil 973 TaxID=2672569 RepID=UPI0012B4EEAE|nr:DUF5005 domain-containing protein [Microlunatus sp. Gsoil 973]QGN33922.1 hypothetical protein GJV80_15105 [Microlunatus sp. Gsoil 973]
MHALPKRVLGAALLAGLAGIIAVPAQAGAEPASGPNPDGFTSCTGVRPKDPTTPMATANTRLTEAFREFGNGGGGWSNHGGWASSDGTYSVKLPGDHVAWLMNDTFLGPVNPDESLTNPGFIHGSILPAHLDGVPYTTITGGTHEAPASIASPPDAVNGDPWYWNGDGIMDGGKLRVFQGRIGQTDGPPPWNFGWLGSDIVTYTKDFTIDKITRTYGQPDGVNWGNELVSCGGYIYIYGIKDSAMHVARARVGQLIEHRWQFWTGDTWSSDPESSTAVTDDVGASYSVTPMNGQFVLTTTSAAIFTDHRIYVATAPTPVGPFTGRTAVYTAPEGGVGNLYAPYNVAAHPEISKPGELVVSYNVNSGNGDDLLADANNCRPRFVTIRFVRSAA